MKNQWAVFVLVVGFLSACGNKGVAPGSLFLGSITRSVGTGVARACTEFSVEGNIDHSKVDGVKDQLRGLGEYSESACSQANRNGHCKYSQAANGGTVRGDIYLYGATEQEISDAETDCERVGGTWNRLK